MDKKRGVSTKNEIEKIEDNLEFFFETKKNDMFSFFVKDNKLFVTTYKISECGNCGYEEKETIEIDIEIK